MPRKNEVVAIIQEAIDGRPGHMDIPIRDGAGKELYSYRITESDIKGGAAQFKHSCIPPPDFASKGRGTFRLCVDARNALTDWSNSAQLRGMQLIAFYRKLADSGGEVVFACYAYPDMLQVVSEHRESRRKTGPETEVNQVAA